MNQAETGSLKGKRDSLMLNIINPSASVVMSVGGTSSGMGHEDERHDHDESKVAHILSGMSRQKRSDQKLQKYQKDSFQLASKESKNVNDGHDEISSRFNGQPLQQSLSHVTLDSATKKHLPPQEARNHCSKKRRTVEMQPQAFVHNVADDMGARLNESMWKNAGHATNVLCVLPPHLEAFRALCSPCSPPSASHTVCLSGFDMNRTNYLGGSQMYCRPNFNGMGLGMTMEESVVLQRELEHKKNSKIAVMTDSYRRNETPVPLVKPVLCRMSAKPQKQDECKKNNHERVTVPDVLYVPPEMPQSSGSSRMCRMESCNERAIARSPHCKMHSGTRKCEYTNCNKCAQGRTRYCISHGGGRRCVHPRCSKAARDRMYCASHGGGKRCSIDGCKKLAIGGYGTCTAHGGGKRCQIGGCPKSAQSGTDFCVRHGGGKLCAVHGCTKVGRGKTSLCMSHARHNI